MRLMILVSLLISSCGTSGPATVAATDMKQTYIIDRTAYFAAKLGVSVVGKLTNEKHTWGCEGQPAGCYDFGWYQAGTAFYYIPAVQDAEMGYLSDAASHEVCHAKWYAHDSHHWCCMKNLGATPTYPYAGVPGGVIECAPGAGL